MTREINTRTPIMLSVSKINVHQQMGIRSPPMKRHTTFHPPDLMTDHSNSASDEDQIDETMDMDQSEDSPMLQDDLLDDGTVSNGFRSGTGPKELELMPEVIRGHQAHSRE